MAATLRREPVVAYVGLGANLGDAPAAIAAAVGRIAQLPGTAVSARSSLYRSAPVDATGPDYTNAVVELRTTLAAPELLSELQRIEQGAGRTRPYQNAPRTLDLDLLLFGSASVQSGHLTVPHPRMHERAFVLLPLAEIAPHLVSASALAAITSQVIARLPASAQD
jgi:2-amino-4-hydroxy-6-hydroxymethyldihydropteridine diphosphokinase